MARPRKLSKEKEDELAKLIEQLASIHCTWEECSAVLGHKSDYLRKRFSEFYLKGKERGRMSLRKKMFESAMGGNTTMMIWLSKQMLGYADKIEEKIEQQMNITDVTYRTKWGSTAEGKPNGESDA